LPPPEVIVTPPKGDNHATNGDSYATKSDNYATSENLSINKTLLFDAFFKRNFAKTLLKTLY
jgi:hypothetical protein